MQEQPHQQAPNDGTQEPVKDEVDPLLLHNALLLLRTVLKGNGVKPSAAEFKSFEGEVLNFGAVAHYKIDPKIGEKHVTGRQRGELCGSDHDMRVAIQKTINKLALSKPVKDYTKTIIKRYDDLGFAQNYRYIALDKYKKTFVMHEPCAPCDTTGKVACQSCHGQGHQPCYTCHGRREMHCPACNGTQYTNTAQGKVQCMRCNGSGRIGCTDCHQSGEMPCRACKGTRKQPCQNCNETGWTSMLRHLDMRAKSLFEDDKTHLPQEACEIIDDIGGETVTDGHVDIVLIDDKNYNEMVEKQSKDDEYIVPYHVRLPWGDIEFTIGGKALGGKLFGYNPSLVHMPPFLEKLLYRPMELMSAAAVGQGDTVDKIQNSARYRAIRESLLAAAVLSEKKATQKLMKIYPFGIREETLRRLIHDCDLALKRVTAKPRQIGLAIGLALTVAIQGFYLFAGIRKPLTAQLDPEILSLVPDLATIGVCGFLTGFMVQSSGKKALNEAIGKFIDKNKGQKKLLPKGGQMTAAGYIAAFLIFIVLTETTRHITGVDTPQWYNAFSDKVE